MLTVGHISLMTSTLKTNTATIMKLYIREANDMNRRCAKCDTKITSEPYIAAHWKAKVKTVLIYHPHCFDETALSICQRLEMRLPKRMR